MRKYLFLFKNHLGVSITYRTDLVAFIINQLIAILSVLILWFAVFKQNDSIGGLDMNYTLLYYILAPLIGFATAVHISSNLPQEIRYGGFSQRLLRPLNIWIGQFLKALSGKLNTFVLVIPIYAIILLLFFLKMNISLSIVNVVYTIILTSSAFVMHFFLDILICWTAFWFQDIWAFKHLKSILFLILGGLNFPFEFLPDKTRSIFEMLPFKYMYYTPLNALIGKDINSNYVLANLAGIIVWGIIFVILAYILWKKGLRKYESFGN